VRVAVVGHVEWVQFARVPQLPAAGEIVHASETWEAAGGGGAVAAVVLARLAGTAEFLTALGDDAFGRAAAEALGSRGVDVHAVWRSEPQRRGFVFVDDDHERTITVMGRRLVPHADDPLPWDSLGDVDAVYFTGGDAGALRAARAARVLVATPRARQAFAGAGVELDALVRSGSDVGETYEPGDLDPPPRIVVTTRGGDGGQYETAEGRTGSWAAAPLPGPPVDSYGAGDSFAAALTYALGEGREIDAALAEAARVGAEALARRGPY
jgi:ribokinase